VTLSDWLEGARLYVFDATPLGSITHRFDVSNFTLQLDADRRSAVDREAALAELERLTLDPAASAEAALEYVQHVEELGRELGLGNDWQLLRDRLVAVGPNHLNALIERWPLSERLRYSVGHPVLREHARESHLSLLLQALRRDPALVWLFQQRGWEAHARPVLRSLVEDYRVPLPAQALAVAAEDAPVELHADLARRFALLERNHEVVASALVKLDGFDLNTAVRRAWRRALLGLADRTGLSVDAARLGLPQALDAAITAVEQGQRSDERGYWYLQLRDVTSYHSPGTSAEPFRDWLLRHWDQFEYDPVARRYTPVGP
jgi:hypothetical protein